MSFKLFINIFSTSARKHMSYRVDFWVTTLLALIVQMAVAYYLWAAIFSESGKSEINGFTMHEIMGYYLVVFLLSKIVLGITEQGGISQDIYEGYLTRYLIYPTRYFTFKYAEALGGTFPHLVQLLVLAPIAVWLMGLTDVIDLNFLSIVMFIGSLFVANLLNFIMFCPIEGIAFWADNVWSLRVMLRQSSRLLGGLMIPLSLFPGWAQELSRVLPFEYLFYFPAQAILGKLSFVQWILGMVIALLWCGAIAFAGNYVWNKGDRVYTGVGI